MNYNKLMFLVIILGLSSISLKAQNENIKEINPVVLNKTLDVNSILEDTQVPAKLKDLQIANRHLDLIKATVRAKIKCTSDLFIIINNKVAC
ncbi:hypothetical protein [Formosa sp. 4Alg 33]|uniref:hypothetical protein n=1 Tax=Formosa sp. 4Alg 33 TaxID=3382189 RepID=UPI003D9C39DF